MRFLRFLFIGFIFTILTTSVFAQTPWFDNTFFVVNTKTEKLLEAFYGRIEAIPEVKPVLKEFEEIIFENSGLSPRKDLKVAGVIAFAGKKGAPCVVSYVAGNFSPEKILTELEAASKFKFPGKKAKIQISKIGKHKIVNFAGKKKRKAVSMFFPKAGLLFFGPKNFIEEIANGNHVIKSAPTEIEKKCRQYDFFAMLETAVVKNIFGGKARGPIRAVAGFVEMFKKAEIGIMGTKLEAIFDCNTSETAKNLKTFFEGQAAGLKMVIENQKKMIQKPGKEVGWLPKAFGYFFQKSLILIAESFLNKTKFNKNDKIVTIESQMPAFAGDVLNPVTIGAVGVVAAIAIPNFKKARAKAQKRACLAVQRNLMAAIEMYNLDHPEESINDINPEIINKLIKGKYLAYNFKLATEKCEFEIIGDLGKGGKIRCKIHGPKSKK